MSKIPKLNEVFNINEGLKPQGELLKKIKAAQPADQSVISDIDLKGQPEVETHNDYLDYEDSIILSYGSTDGNIDKAYTFVVPYDYDFRGMTPGMRGSRDRYGAPESPDDPPEVDHDLKLGKEALLITDDSELKVPVSSIPKKHLEDAVDAELESRYEKAERGDYDPSGDY